MQETSQQDRNDSIPTKRIQLHGVLVRVLDTGILLIGESGIGKSECALELVTKGYQLVADDVVDLFVTDDAITGKAPSLTFELLEIRGLGIIYVRELYGDAAVRPESTVDLCVELQNRAQVERIENVVGEYFIDGNSIPKYVLPVSSGRNLSTLVETAARLFIRHQSGATATSVLLEKHAALLNPTR